MLLCSPTTFYWGGPALSSAQQLAVRQPLPLILKIWTHYGPSLPFTLVMNIWLQSVFTKLATAEAAISAYFAAFIARSDAALPESATLESDTQVWRSVRENQWLGSWQRLGEWDLIDPQRHGCFKCKPRSSLVPSAVLELSWRYVPLAWHRKLGGMGQKVHIPHWSHQCSERNKLNRSTVWTKQLAQHVTIDSLVTFIDLTALKNLDKHTLGRNLESKFVGAQVNLRTDTIIKPYQTKFYKTMQNGSWMSWVPDSWAHHSLQ